MKGSRFTSALLVVATLGITALSLHTSEAGQDEQNPKLFAETGTGTPASRLREATRRQGLRPAPRGGKGSLGVSSVASAAAFGAANNFSIFNGKYTHYTATVMQPVGSLLFVLVGFLFNGGEGSGCFAQFSGAFSSVCCRKIPLSCTST